MAVTRKIDKKAPTQKPTAFFKCEQQGGTHGKPTHVPDKLEGGPMRETTWGRPTLSKQ